MIDADFLFLVLGGLLQTVSLVVFFGMRELWIREGEEPARCFGVPFTGSETAAAERTLQRYRIQLVGHAIIATALGIVWSNRILPTVWFAFGAVLAFGWARRRARTFEVAWEPPSSPMRHAASVRRRPVRSALFAAGPFTLLAASTTLLFACYEQLPATIPIHFSSSGRADHWVPTTALAVGMPAIVAFLLLAYLRLVGWLLETHTRQELSSTGEVNRKVTFATLRVVEYSIALLFGVLSWFPLLSPPFRQALVLPMAVGAGPVTVAFVAWRMSNAAGESGAAASFGELEARREKHWRFGVFYVNADDPALLAPKLVGIGYTINFGHSKAWWLLSLLLLGPVLIAGSALVLVATGGG